MFDTQNPETTLNRINNTLDRLENLINNVTIENISQSTKDWIQVLANRLNGRDISKTLGEITSARETNHPTGKHSECSDPKRTNGRNVTTPETTVPRDGRLR